MKKNKKTFLYTSLGSLAGLGAIGIASSIFFQNINNSKKIDSDIKLSYEKKHNNKIFNRKIKINNFSNSNETLKSNENLTYEVKLLLKYDYETFNNIDDYRLKKDETFSRQKGKMFTDYDLSLEKKDGKHWETIEKISVIDSNVELIRYKATEDGEYRIRVKKHGNIFNNSVDDKLAISFTKK